MNPMYLHAIGKAIDSKHKETQHKAALLAKHAAIPTESQTKHSQRQHPTNVPRQPIVLVSTQEGYPTNGNLHYVPYDNDARVSHAHGWATGPTSSLSFYVTGLRLNGPIGRTWLIQPMLGSLERVAAGFETPLGRFSGNWTASTGGLTGCFEAPAETSGVFVSPAGNKVPILSGSQGRISPSSVNDTMYTYRDLPGGIYTLDWENHGSAWSS